ncbi:MULTISPECIES: hypothetical protein [Bacteria]|uniref:hypothetical protein n=1 Tax=Bacteria TaxID=2 RepID=UPI003C7AE713
MLTEIEVPVDPTSNAAHETHAKRPGGGVITGWVAVFLAGLLAFLNATTATEAGWRAFFIACGAVLIVGGAILIARWYRTQGRSEQHSSD